MGEIKHVKTDWFWKKVKSQHPTAAGVLDIAFNCDGFCAGGFPRALRRAGRNKLSSVFWRWSDVDIWFRTDAGRKEFLNRIASEYSTIYLHDSFGGFARVFEIPLAGEEWDGEAVARAIFQTISCKLGEPEKVIGDFDFVNCRIAFDSENSWYDTSLPICEERGELEIANWNNPLLLSRINKYWGRHGYGRMTPETREKLASWIHDTYFELPQSQHGQTVSLVNQPKFLHQVRTLIQNKQFVTDEDLVLLQGIFSSAGDDMNYGTAFGTLLKRNTLSSEENED